MGSNGRRARQRRGVLGPVARRAASRQSWPRWASRRRSRWARCSWATRRCSRHSRKGVAPVTDNYPLRLSAHARRRARARSALRAAHGRTTNVARASRKALTSTRSGHPSSKSAATPYFRYEGMIKRPCSLRICYRDARDPFLWEAHRRRADAAAVSRRCRCGCSAATKSCSRSRPALAPGEQPRRELELALGALAHRDFGAALERMRSDISQGDEKTPAGDLKLAALSAREERAVARGARADRPPVDPAETAEMGSIRGMVRRTSSRRAAQRRRNATQRALPDGTPGGLTRATIRKSSPTLRNSSNVTFQPSASDASAGMANIPRAESPSSFGAIYKNELVD